MPPRKVKSMKALKILDITGKTYIFNYEDIYIYNFEYTPNVLRIDFKNGGFVEFTRQNIVYINLIVDDEEEIQNERT